MNETPSSSSSDRWLPSLSLPEPEPEPTQDGWAWMDGWMVGCVDAWMRGCVVRYEGNIFNIHISRLHCGDVQRRKGMHDPTNRDSISWRRIGVQYRTLGLAEDAEWRARCGLYFSLHNSKRHIFRGTKYNPQHNSI